MVDRLAEDLLARGIVAELRRSVVSFDCTTFGQAYSSHARRNIFAITTGISRLVSGHEFDGNRLR